MSVVGVARCCGGGSLRRLPCKPRLAARAAEWMPLAEPSTSTVGGTKSDAQGVPREGRRSSLSTPMAGPGSVWPDTRIVRVVRSDDPSNRGRWPRSVDPQRSGSGRLLLDGVGHAPLRPDDPGLTVCHAFPCAGGCAVGHRLRGGRRCPRVDHCSPRPGSRGGSQQRRARTWSSHVRRIASPRARRKTLAVLRDHEWALRCAREASRSAALTVRISTDRRRASAHRLNSTALSAIHAACETMNASWRVVHSAGPSAAAPCTTRACPTARIAVPCSLAANEGARRAGRSDLLARAPGLQGRIDGPRTPNAVHRSLPFHDVRFGGPA